MDARENLQDKCNLEALTYDDKIEYWHTHETGNSLREFLGMTEEKYLDFVLGKDKKITGKPKMDVREKLVELQSIITCPNEICNFCEHFKNKGACEKHKKEVIADNMIAHGVTVQELDGCEYCKEDNEGFRRMFGAFYLVNPFHGKTWQIHAGKCKPREINFCPMCGRKLPQPPKGE